MEHSTNKSTFTIARVASLILLAVVGITALLGGSALIIDPSEHSMSIKLDGLAGTMFDDYRAPGVILFLAIGGLSSAVELYSSREILKIIQSSFFIRVLF